MLVLALLAAVERIVAFGSSFALLVGIAVAADSA